MTWIDTAMEGRQKLIPMIGGLHPHDRRPGMLRLLKMNVGAGMHGRGTCLVLTKESIVLIEQEKATRGIAGEEQVTARG